MAKPRKMLHDVDAPYIQSLMRLIESQSKETIATWSISYAREKFLPLWERDRPDDGRPKAALVLAQQYLSDEVKLSDAKQAISEARKAARETEGLPILQGSARTIDAAASAIHNSAGSLGLALYGALTLAYEQLGTDASWDELEAFAAHECSDMEMALKNIAVTNEPNPAKISWGC